MEQREKDYLDDIVTYYKKYVDLLVDMKMEILDDLANKSKDLKLINLKEKIKK